MTRVLVTGGTGELGRQVVARLLADGRSVRVLSRRAQADVAPGAEIVPGDFATGIGLPEAVVGVETIVHCASNGRREADVTGSGRLVEAAATAGARHLVYISIVGVDRHPLPYYKMKLEVEGIIRRGRVPWTTLRATQFHSFALRFLQLQARLPVLLLPRGFRFQPIDSGEVAARLAALALGEPLGRILDTGGPQVRTAEDLGRSYLAATGRRVPVVSVPIPGRSARAFRAGVNLTPEHADGVVTWEEYLRTRPGLHGRAREARAASRA